MKRRCHLSILFLFLVYVNNPFGITSIGTLTGRVFHFKMTMTPKISILIENYVDKFNVIKYIMTILCYENIEKRRGVFYSLKLIKCQQYFRASLCSIHSSKTEHREKNAIENRRWHEQFSLKLFYFVAHDFHKRCFQKK